ncbi:porphobilinogen deaminase [Phlyctochytrium planicorne]|nr:porphobilinogen deaminase [Phlyctochytrium planicorne]
MENPKTVITIGTRESQLAMVQAKHVHALLQKHHPSIDFRINGMTTTGDQILDVSLSKIGAKSLFTKELEVALADGAVDLVVHSLKDLPTTLPPGMMVGAILEREDPRDAVVMAPRFKDKKIEELPEGSTVGTSSVRRIAQLKRRFPGLNFMDVRGNLNTRLRKLDADDSPYAALLLAHAGLIRLGWHDRVSQILPPEIILHAVGQGALGIEIRSDDTLTASIIKELDHRTTRIRCMAERAFMRKLEGGCSVPLGVWTEVKIGEGGKETLVLSGCVCSVDGKEEILENDEVELSGDGVFEQAEALGTKLAVRLVELGAKDILDKIRK